MIDELIGLMDAIVGQLLLYLSLKMATNLACL